MALYYLTAHCNATLAEFIACNINLLTGEQVAVDGRRKGAASLAVADSIVIGILYLIGNRITCRIVENHDVVTLHITVSLQTAILDLRMLKVTLRLDDRERVLREREVDRRHRNTRTVAHLVHPKIVAHEQGLFKRRGRNAIILSDKGKYKIDQHQRVDNGVYPTHDGAHRLAF